MPETQPTGNGDGDPTTPTPTPTGPPDTVSVVSSGAVVASSSNPETVRACKAYIARESDPPTPAEPVGAGTVSGWQSNPSTVRSFAIVVQGDGSNVFMVDGDVVNQSDWWSIMDAKGIHRPTAQ